MVSRCVQIAYCHFLRLTCLRAGLAMGEAVDQPATRLQIVHFRLHSLSAYPLQIDIDTFVDVLRLGGRNASTPVGIKPAGPYNIQRQRQPIAHI